MPMCFYLACSSHFSSACLSLCKDKKNTPSAGYSKGVIRGAGEGPEEGGGRGNRGSKTGRQQKQVRKGYLNVVTYFFSANKGVYYIPV